MADVIATVEIPDTEMVREATALVRRTADDTLFHHSRRVFLWGSLKARARGLSVDAELAYVGGLFHDLGLTAAYRASTQRFEIDGADAARAFLLEQGRTEREAESVWLGIALHTTPDVPHRLPPEVAVVSLGVETDVLGIGLEEIDPGLRAEVLSHHPRPGFKEQILRHFYDGFAHRPASTFGTMNDDVIAHFDPSFSREDFAQIVLNSPWSE